MALWILGALAILAAVFALSGWVVRHRARGATKQYFAGWGEAFLAGKLSIDEWDWFLAQPMEDPELDALRQRLAGFAWEVGGGREELEEAIRDLRQTGG